MLHDLPIKAASDWNRATIRGYQGGLDRSPGRRLRVFAMANAHWPKLPSGEPDRWTITIGDLYKYATIGDLYKYAKWWTGYPAQQACSNFPCNTWHSFVTKLEFLSLRFGYDAGASIKTLPDVLNAHNLSPGGNPALHSALQDLGDEIIEDIVEALETLDNPSHYYPGIDEGIEPVTDDHVELVIFAMQRELNRELRATYTRPLVHHVSLPAAPLNQLSPAVQRALVERRRLRFAQFGIGRTAWQANCWSVWNVPEDPDWVPRRAQRLAEIKG